MNVRVADVMRWHRTLTAGAIISVFLGSMSCTRRAATTSSRSEEDPDHTRAVACDKRENDRLYRKMGILMRGAAEVRVAIHMRGDGTAEKAVLVQPSESNAANDYALCMAMAQPYPP